MLAGKIFPGNKKIQQCSLHCICTYTRYNIQNNNIIMIITIINVNIQLCLINLLIKQKNTREITKSEIIGEK